MSGTSGFATAFLDRSRQPGFRPARLQASIGLRARGARRLRERGGTGSLAAPYHLRRVGNIEQYFRRPLVADTVCGLGGNVSLPYDADAAAGQKLPRHAFFQFAHATELPEMNCGNATRGFLYRL